VKIGQYLLQLTGKVHIQGLNEDVLSSLINDLSGSFKQQKWVLYMHHFLQITTFEQLKRKAAEIMVLVVLNQICVKVSVSPPVRVMIR
jgi:hypothetical protein